MSYAPRKCWGMFGVSLQDQHIMYSICSNHLLINVFVAPQTWCCVPVPSGQSQVTQNKQDGFWQLHIDLLVYAPIIKLHKGVLTGFPGLELNNSSFVCAFFGSCTSDNTWLRTTRPSLFIFARPARSGWTADLNLKLALSSTWVRGGSQLKHKQNKPNVDCRLVKLLRHHPDL